MGHPGRREGGAELSVDVMPTASRAQTRNQADGQVAATRGLWLQLAGTYDLRSDGEARA